MVKSFIWACRRQQSCKREDTQDASRFREMGRWHRRICIERADCGDEDLPSVRDNQGGNARLIGGQPHNLVASAWQSDEVVAAFGARIRSGSCGKSLNRNRL
jgi:hypothetical protein